MLSRSFPAARKLQKSALLSASFSRRCKHVFDRDLKARHRDFSLSVHDGEYYDYLRQESASRIVDRIEDIMKDFPLALELGCHRGHLYDLINAQEGLNGTGGIGGIEKMYQCDISVNAMKTTDDDITTTRRVEPVYLNGDEEQGLPFNPDTFDIVLSSCYMHWINDLPKVLQNIKSILKPDGVFIGSMLGGSTLEELRYCLYVVEQERLGGVRPHTSPLALPSDIAGLIQGAGFSLPTIDVDTVTVSYPNAITLMEHLGK